MFLASFFSYSSAILYMEKLEQRQHVEFCAAVMQDLGQDYVDLLDACRDGSAERAMNRLCLIIGDKATGSTRHVMRVALDDAYRSGRADVVSCFLQVSYPNPTKMQLADYIIELYVGWLTAACQNGFMHGLLILLSAGNISGCIPSILREHPRLIHKASGNVEVMTRLEADDDHGGRLTSEDIVRVVSRNPPFSE